MLSDVMQNPFLKCRNTGYILLFFLKRQIFESGRAISFDLLVKR